LFKDKLRLLVVEARAHADLADAMLAGARQAIEAADADHDVITAPGAFEIPGLIANAEEGGHRPAGVRYDGFIALACVFRDETYQFNVVAHETARGLMDLSIGKRLIIGNGVLNLEHVGQAGPRLSGDGGGAGGAAVRSCLSMIALRRRLLGAIR
jgi:6,7-dimethyl-8-ribityllumazine synthase